MNDTYYRVFIKILEERLKLAESINNLQEIRFINRTMYDFYTHHETFLAYQKAFQDDEV